MLKKTHLIGILTSKNTKYDKMLKKITLKYDKYKFKLQTIWFR